jgi:hypothetical protein
VETRRLPDGTRVVLKRCPDALLENPPPSPNAVGYLVLAAFAGAALYAIFRPKKAAAATALPTTCPPITPERLRLFHEKIGGGLVQIAGETTPPIGIVRQDRRIDLYAIEDDKPVPFGVPGSSEPQSFAQPLIVILGNGEFWRYEGEPDREAIPQLSPDDREAFCNFNPAAAVSGIQWIEG